MFWKLQNQSLYYTDFMLSYDNCVQLNGLFCNLSKSTWLCSRNHNSLIFYRFFQLSYQNKREICLFACFFGCTLIYIILSSLWYIVTFTSGKELFWRVYYEIKSFQVTAILKLNKLFKCKEVLHVTSLQFQQK